MLVMGAQADVDADVVEQAGHLQQQPLAVAEPVLVAELVEQARGEHRDVLAVVAIEAVAVAERLGAGQHLVLEVLCGDPALRLGDVEQHAGPQRRVRHDQAAAGGFGEQRAIDEQRRQQRFGFDRRQPEPIDQPVLVQPLDLVAEREKLLARHLPDVGVGLIGQSATPRTARRRRSRSRS